MYYNLLNTWCPADGNVKAFLPNTGEEVEFIPGWLRLKMICSNVERLEDAGDLHSKYITFSHCMFILTSQYDVKYFEIEVGNAEV